MKNVKIIYPANEFGEILPDYTQEAQAMESIGFRVSGHKNDEDKCLIYRGSAIRKKESYPSDSRYVNNWIANERTQFMSRYFSLIEDFTIPTFFLNDLTQPQFMMELRQREWDKVFIRSDSKSLYFDDINKCLWPQASLDLISKHYTDYGFTGPFAVRKFIDQPELFYDEQRYWVINGNPYHPSMSIPDFVNQTAQSIFKFSGSRYFTIDVAGSFIVEINPGESSDRGCDNSLDFFCQMFYKEFLE